MEARIERWLPREERRTALWLAGTMVVLVVLPQLRLPAFASFETPWPSMLAWAAA